MTLDLSALGIKLGKSVVAEANVKVVVDSSTGKVTLHVDDKLGPFVGPTLDFEVDPIHALHLASVGVGQALGNVFNKKSP